VETISPRLRTTVPKFLIAALRDGEDVLGVFPAFACPNKRKAQSERQKLLLTTQRLIHATDRVFSKRSEEVPYSRVSSVTHHKGFLSNKVILHTPGVTLTIPKIKHDALFIDHIVSGCKAGVTFEVHDTELDMAYSTPKITQYVAPLPTSTAQTDGAVRTTLDFIDPLEFEELVRQLFERMGYEAKLTKASHDGGIDIEVYDSTPIRGGRLLVQCKRYNGVVGASYVRDLFGVVQHEGASKGILVTTSHFSPDAISFARGKPLELIDRTQFEVLLQEHGFTQPCPATMFTAQGDISTPHASPVNSTSYALTRSPVLQLAQPSSGWKKSARILGYICSVLCILAGFGGDQSALAFGLDLLVIMLLATNAWRLRAHVPLFNSPTRWH